MGGPNSGRRRERNACAIEDTLWLDLRLLRRWGFLRAGSVSAGQVRWARKGAPVANCSVNVDLTNPGRPFVIAHMPGLTRQRIDLASVPCPFGGERFYFVCPRTRAWCLVLPFLDGQFASRRAHRITYGSQSDGVLDRTYRKRDKLAARLLGASGTPRPRGVKRQRLAQRLEAARVAARKARSDQLRRQLGMS